MGRVRCRAVRDSPVSESVHFADEGGVIGNGGHDSPKLKTHQRAGEGLAFVPQGRMMSPNLTVAGEHDDGGARLAGTI